MREDKRMDSVMNILVTICARAGSKGVKSKNVRNFCGKPLLYYTLAAYKDFCENKPEEVNDIQLALNTDSQELISQMDGTGEDYILIERDQGLAGDTVAKFDVIKDTLIKAENIKHTVFDIVLDLDLTSPIRTWEDIQGTVFALLRDEQADISYSVTEARRSPYFNMVCRKENCYFGTVMESNVVARQQTPSCYDMNASIYAYRKEHLMTGTMHKRNAVIWVMWDTGILDIDHEGDLELMEVIFRHFVDSDEKYAKQFGKLVDE